MPVIGKKDGRYIGTLTEGDLLWYIKDYGDLSIRRAEEISMQAVARRYDNEPVDVDVDMENLINKAMNQNFVPVIDDRERFIGLITRKDLIQYLCRKLVTIQLEAGGMGIR
ncbi:hypothetical protein IMSAGC019_03964 [Lachnospiraceae bacterium]|nr:hypothetical protein IMSAGC019_03964 [Lachnospiraceae bacterium]